MRYSFYQDRKPGDRISDRSGRAGIVTEVRGAMTGHDTVAVRWDDGSLSKNYIMPQHLMLVRTVSGGRISRARLAEMLKKR